MELKKEGLFAGALIKKRKNWHALVLGDANSERFEMKSVGEMNIIRGNLSGIEYFIWGMKKEYYVKKAQLVVH